MKIVYIVHSTSLDNERGVVSGLRDVPLSGRGEEQARQLAQSWPMVGTKVGRLFTSPLRRARQTAQLLFQDQPSQQDHRLSEIDYGDYTGRERSVVEEQRHRFVQEPYPSGQSYSELLLGIEEFCYEQSGQELITVVGHQATQFCLEVLCQGKSWHRVFVEDWRLYQAWQPFWCYSYDGQALISFEPLEKSHFSLMVAWLEATHVKRWWDQDLHYTLEVVEEKFGCHLPVQPITSGLKKSSYPYIILLKGIPIGYIQAYNARAYREEEQLLDRFEGPICGIDLFIGEADQLHRGLGPTILREFAKQLLLGHFRWFLLDPSPENSAAIRAFEKAGFRVIDRSGTAVLMIKGVE